MSIGNNIRKIRENRNISLDEMVKKLSIFRQTYINIERGLIKPTQDIILRISNVFNLSEKDIINYNEEFVINQNRQLDLKNLKDIISSIEGPVKSKETSIILTPVTNTPINVVLEDLSIKEVVYKKPILLKSSEIFQIGDRIKTVGVKDALPSEIFINNFGELDPNLVVKKDRSFSSKLLNWIEPYVINGVEKTLFFTEVNTGLKLGDRVFILNGNYDSNRFLQDNKYKSSVDGYRVLFVDNCRIVLDINYDKERLPFIDETTESIDDFINIYFIDKQEDFLQANRQISSRNGDFGYKFSNNRNNIAFFNNNFNSIVNDWGTSSAVSERGFYVKQGNNWENISNDIIVGSFSSALSLEYNNNGKIKIHNGSFTFSVGPEIVSFVEGFIYEWKVLNQLDGVPGTASSWIVDSRYNVPFITKSNFRKGNFNGIFNSGVFGTNEKRIRWDKEDFSDATWNTGILLNTNWISGDMKSINSLPESYVSEFDKDNRPYQKLNGPNNNGRGFNYIENSSFINGVVDNAVFNNSIIGESLTDSVVEDYIIGLTNSYNFTIKSGLIEKSSINSGLVKDTDVVNSRVLNSKLENVKSINSNYKLSIIKDSIYISDNIIKILGYDEFTIKEKPSNQHSHKVYKFYITKKDYDRLKIRDRFYIKGLSILDNSKYPLNFFDRRFRLSSWTEYFDSYKNNQFIKKGVEVGAFLSTPGDNEWKLNYIISPTNKTVVTEENENKNYSVDIIVSTYDIDNFLFTNDGITNELPINGLGINKNIISSISGKADLSLRLGSGFNINSRINAVKIDTNGRILLGGNFNIYRNITTNGIIRLNPDGTKDLSFNVGVGFNTGAQVYDINIDSNGRIIVGGIFNSYKNIPVNNLVILNNDGDIIQTLNLTDVSNTGIVRRIEIDSNDRIIVGGWFTLFNDEQIYTSDDLGGLIRFKIDDTIDITTWVKDDNFLFEGFESISFESVYDIKIDDSDNIFVSGIFNDYNNYNKVIKLFEDGIIDTSFISYFNDDSTSIVKVIELENDNILIGGKFDTYSQSVNNMIRLDETGELDDTFIPNFNNDVNDIILVDNKIYVVGEFNTPSSKIERLNLNGSPDTNFNIPNPNRFNTTGIVYKLDIDEFGKIYAVGEFNQYDNQQYINLVKINPLFSEPISRNIVDVTQAYIVNSDFESGILENSDWISGNHINFNNDVNIVNNNFGTYSITPTEVYDNSIIIETGYNDFYKETDSDCLEENNIVFLSNIEYQSDIGEITKLGDTYKIIINDGNQLVLQEIGTNILSNLNVSGGTFSTISAQNRYNYIFKAKINKSKISSGIFRRSYITNSFIEDENFITSDRDFNNLINIRNLVISDSIFKNNSNILSKALYMNSSFVSGNDRFENGIVFNSIWNGMNFFNGLFKESRWVNGEFNAGLFYNNRSLPILQENLKSYYKDGITSTTQSNNRYSWQNGQFNDGEFFESNWEGGDFNGGKFYYSNFYNGIINGGVIGDKSIPIEKTVVYNGTINFTTVNNALIESSDINSTPSTIIWKDGQFNGGEFKSTGNSIAIWENGQFNSGNFESNSIWKNGSFNGGRFLSTYGWELSFSDIRDHYTWQDGEFNGGEFGNASTEANSTWFTGEFNGGKFVGRVWNNGIFTNGDFIGSATYSAIRGVTATQSNALLFTESFTSSYYGLWRNGVVSDRKDDFIKDREIISPKTRVKSRQKLTNTNIVNSLWLGGTFSHSSGIIENSVWLNGIFEKGIFFRSSFNPYVNRMIDNIGYLGGYTNPIKASVTSVLVDYDNNRIYLFGFFTDYNGVIVNHLVATDLNLKIDPNFNTNGFNTFPFTPNRILKQSDDKIVLVGNFTEYYSENLEILNGSIIKRLTSNNVDIASAGTNSENAWKVFDKVTSPSNLYSPESGWTSDGGIGQTAWISYKLEEPKIAKRYYLLRSDTFNPNNSRPTGWIFQGSHDGISWDDIETVSNYTAALSYLSPNLANTTAYLYYRIFVNAVNSGTNARIFEFDISESETITSVVSANRIIRLNLDGSFDTTFNVGTGFNSYTTGAFLDNNGKIYVIGNFTSYNGTAANRIIRLNSDGSIDTGFDYGSGFNAVVTSLAVDYNNDIYVTGYFTTYKGESGNNRIIKILENGEKDTSFDIGSGLNANNRTSSVYITSDNKVFVIGFFTEYNGQPANKMVKLNTNGTIDTSFQSFGFTGSNIPSGVESETHLTNFYEYQGNYIISGNFTEYNGVPSNETIILDTSGNIVKTFDVPTRVQAVLDNGDLIISVLRNNIYSLEILEKPSFELSDSCLWKNGDLIDSDFYISKWEKGKFDTGDAYGMIWKDGVCNYMNAFNIFWEGGLWRNGNWYGSYMNYNGTIENDFYKQILLRGASWSGTQSMHLWNIFDDSSASSPIISASASDISQI
jgi:uncharacterized delta-60 repeat protein